VFAYCGFLFLLRTRPGSEIVGYEFVIQYWFFYPFNDGANNHEGDWEHINVIVTIKDREDSLLSEKEIERIFAPLFVVDSEISSNLDCSNGKKIPSNLLEDLNLKGQISLSQNSIVTIRRGIEWSITDNNKPDTTDDDKSYTIREGEDKLNVDAGNNNKFDIDLEFQDDLDRKDIPDGLRSKFERNEIPLSGNAIVTIEKGIEWLITDNGSKQTYTIKKEGNKLNVYLSLNLG